MTIDPGSEVARLCAAGMEVDGDPAAALALFMQAWECRRDDRDASIAAHFVARHQGSAEEALYWNRLAVEHAEKLSAESAEPLLPSLYLNLGESYRVLGNHGDARLAVTRGLEVLKRLPPDGYLAFVARGLTRLKERLVRGDDS